MSGRSPSTIGNRLHSAMPPANRCRSEPNGPLLSAQTPLMIPMSLPEIRFLCRSKTTSNLLWAKNLGTSVLKEQRSPMAAATRAVVGVAGEAVVATEVGAAEVVAEEFE